MTMTSINGFPIYAVTIKEVPCELSYFAKQASTWVEGSRRNQLSEEEIQDLKSRYKCDDAFESKMNLAGAFGGMGTMLGVGGLDSYRSWYEYAKSTTDVDVEHSRYFQEYQQFLSVLDQIGI